ncbi:MULTISPECIES: hypothetical protein [unclassified Streptomyces]|uniref:hypothetical protein n=1 Tax=unclassified Streptomyces TaxID=2593676 RepID=UPI0009401E6F|nr:hypothetical protein [Streptomyces sp. TSRI0281]OKI34245.1 hypothetical protein A6A29_18365 [Streptomyces sp. TSRI0281]
MNPTPSKTSTAPAVDDDREEKTAAADAGAEQDAPVTADDRDEAADDGTAEAVDPAADDESALDDEDLEPDAFAEASRGVGAGAAAVVAAGLGIVSLTGAWTGRVAAERETLIGQISTSGGGSAAQQISEIYGDAWHTTALVNGLFALLALLVGLFVLVRPAFGAPSDRPQPGWIRAVALAGVALGVLGVLISAGMYFDLFVSLPSAGAPTSGG